MPVTGYDPYGGWDSGSPIDNSGGGLDPSYAWSLAAGGGFPGADQNLMEYLAAQSTGANAGNPDYHLPAFIAWLASHAGASGSLARNVIGRLASGHEANVQSPGSGQTPEGLSGGYPHHFFSGPGASYGPADGPGTGLVDFGRGVASEWDLPESKPPGQSGSGSPGGGKGGGKGGGHILNWQPYGGMSHQASFVDWQPIQPGTPGPYEPTRFVGGGRSAPAQASPPASLSPPGGRSPRTPSLGGGSGRPPGGGAAQPGSRPGRGGGPSTPPGPSPGSGFNPGDQRPFGSNPLAPNVGAAARENSRGGVNVNNLDRGTPGWLEDPTAGTTNTSGFPGATLPAPRLGETFDAYMTRLHDAGFSNEDIMSATGRHGFQQGRSNVDDMGPDAAAWSWDWGTGPVVRGPGGYQFANQAGGGGNGGGVGSSSGPGPTGSGGNPGTLDSLLIPLY